jgi:hypothetical protein
MVGPIIIGGQIRDLAGADLVIAITGLVFSGVGTARTI